MNAFRAIVPALALVFALPLAAQDRPPPDTAARPAAAEAPRVDAQPSIKAFWGGLGVAIGTPGLGVQIDATLRNDDRVMRGRLLAIGGAVDSDQRTVFVTELAGMYSVGTRFGRSANWYSAAAGLALLTGDRDEEEFTTIGVPVELQAISRRSPHLGATLMANLNAEIPFIAATLSLQLGRVP
jgi:hypothetical protein